MQRAYGNSKSGIYDLMFAARATNVAHAALNGTAGGCV
jgi:hypothetical protein